MRTLTDHAEEYHAHLRSLNYSRTTLETSFYNVRTFVRWLQRTHYVQTPDRIRAKHLQAWLKYLGTQRTQQGKPLKERAINKKIENVRGFLKYLVKNHLLQKPLLDVLEYVKEPRMLPGNILTHAQVRKLLSRIDTSTAEGHRNRAMLEVLYSGGLRVSELITLNLDDVDLAQGTLKVTGKGNKQRVVPIGKTALRYLESYIVAVRSYLVKDRKDSALFIDNHGKRASRRFLGRYLPRYAEQAGIDIPVTPHTFRRSCTTELVRSGASLYHVKELLGHETLDTLKHYARLTINDLRKTHAKCHPREKDE